MPNTANQNWRQYNTDLVPSSGDYDPEKSKLREWGTYIESLTQAAGYGNTVWFATKALLDADLAHAAGTPAVVYNDSTSTNNGIYIKSGASGAGAWGQILNFLPGYQFVTATNSGAGTANAIQATSSPTLTYTSGVQLVAVNITTDNTASPVTISFDGGASLTMKTAAGNDIPTGGLATGMIVAGIISGSTFRLFSDLSSDAILSAMEDLADEVNAAVLPFVTIVKSYYDVVTPYDHGATDPEDPEDATVNAAAIQAALDEVAVSFDAAKWRMSKRLDLGGKVWTVDPVVLRNPSSSGAGVQTPGTIIANGDFCAAVAGEPQLSLADCNHVLLDGVRFSSVIGTIPSCALVVGRRDSDKRSAGNHRFNNVDIQGHYSEIAFLDVASEANSFHNLQIRNLSLDVNAAAMAIVDNVQTLTDQGVGGIAPDWVTLMASGTASNIEHVFSGKTEILRSPAYSYVISSMTRTNPCVCTVTTAAATGRSNGDAVFFPDTVGLVNASLSKQVKGNYYYISVSGTNGEIWTLYTDAGLTTPLDTSDLANWTAFTSGTVRNRTGPALILAGACDVELNSYLLASGNFGLIRDFKNGASMTGNHLTFQNETLPPSQIKNIAPDSGVAYEVSCSVLSLGRNQTHGSSLITTTTGGTGVIESRDCRYDFAQATFAWSTGRVFANPSLHRIGRGTRIYLPNTAYMNATTSFALFEGEVVTSDGTRTVGGPVSYLDAVSVAGLLTVSGGQIAFPATQNPSTGANVLDDYEEGTWTPDFTCATPGDLAKTLSSASGTYTKVGRLVTTAWTMVTSAFTHSTAAGAVSITGFPFTCVSAGGLAALNRFGGITKASYTFFAPSMQGAAAAATLYACGSGVANTTLNITDMPSGGTIVLIGGASYIT